MYSRNIYQYTLLACLRCLFMLQYAAECSFDSAKSHRSVLDRCEQCSYAAIDSYLLHSIARKFTKNPTCRQARHSRHPDMPPNPTFPSSRQSHHPVNPTNPANLSATSSFHSPSAYRNRQDTIFLSNTVRYMTLHTPGIFPWPFYVPQCHRVPIKTINSLRCLLDRCEPIYHVFQLMQVCSYMLQGHAHELSLRK